MLCYFFLNLSKIDILENLRFLARSFSASCVLTCPVESKPNSRMIKMKTIGVVLMASSIIDKKSPRRGRRAEHQSTDSRRQTRRRDASRSLQRLDLSSYYFLKRSKIDISGNLRFLARSAGGLPNHWPQNSTQLLNKDECFHFSSSQALRDRSFVLQRSERLSS